MNYKTAIPQLVGFTGFLLIVCTHLGTNFSEERNIFDKCTLTTFEKATQQYYAFNSVILFVALFFIILSIVLFL